jgi:hypothetical protein
MTNPKHSLSAECRVFASYMVGQPPSPYVCRKYAEAHDCLESLAVGSRFDHALVRFARAGTLRVRVADSYSQIFLPHSLLRKKLVLLLAILETCAPTYRLIDEVDPVARPILIAKMAARGVGAIASLLVGTLLLFPVWLALSSNEENH